MPVVVIEVGEIVDSAELGIIQITLLGRKDPVLKDTATAKGDRERNRIDVPVASEAHPGSTLMHQAHRPGVRKLALETGGPVDDIGIAQVGIAQRRGAAAKAGT